MNTQMNNELQVNTTAIIVPYDVTDERIKRLVKMLDTHGYTLDERLDFSSKQIEKHTIKGVSILSKQNAEINKKKEKFDEIESRQKEKFERKQLARRIEFEKKNQELIDETTNDVVTQIKVWEGIKELYEDPGPMLK